MKLLFTIGVCLAWLTAFGQGVNQMMLLNQNPKKPGPFPVLWYKFAGDTLDYSTNGNNGTATGSPSYTTGPNGVATTAIAFNGTSQYVTATTNTLTAFERTQPFSISTWVNFSSHTIDDSMIITYNTLLPLPLK